MRVVMLATIWVALAGFVAGQAGVGRHRRTASAPHWLWPIWCFGLIACVVHILLAMGSHHHWSHASAVADTARQTEAVYGLAWGGGLYVNYLFVIVWLSELMWWRLDPERYFAQPAWSRRALRGFYLVMVFNAAVVFAAPDRRLAGLAMTAALVAAWLVVPLPASKHRGARDS